MQWQSSGVDLTEVKERMEMLEEKRRPEKEHQENYGMNIALLEYTFSEILGQCKANPDKYKHFQTILDNFKGNDNWHTW